MKKLTAATFLILALIAYSFSPIAYATDLTLNNTPVKVCFTPGGQCAGLIAQQIEKAKSEILVQAYSFTSTPIAHALVAAHKRGLKVEAVLDKSQRSQKYTSASFLANSRIPTFIDAAHAIAHNKVMVIDREIVITGSYNFTKAAEEKNAENLLIIKSRELADLYFANWQKHREHSEPYAARY